MMRFLTQKTLKKETLIGGKRGKFTAIKKIRLYS
ncbi:unnamed protein product [Medioppia subpectinata]|uniref:Uncharacterized protein n=1 Tax=Medioppia subpectinata TaxID=1979941 RepID=A0A7R9M0R0_9ACAR|nr:unnamed protein product [Medioppia subpectinata]CAG2123377.1 unnamed protein product [Medioppia subpectinata]